MALWRGNVVRTALLVAASMLIEALPVLPAAAIEMQPGLWELTSKVDRNGAASTRPPRSLCVTAETANAARARTDFDLSGGAKAGLNARFGRDACKLVEAKNSQDLMSWRLQCTSSPSAEQEGTARFDNPRHYLLVIRTSITASNKTVTSVTTTEGRHIGECPR